MVDQTEKQAIQFHTLVTVSQKDIHISEFDQKEKEDREERDRE